MNNIAMTVERMFDAGTQQVKTNSKAAKTAPFEIPQDLTQTDESNDKPQANDIGIDTTCAAHEPKTDNIAENKTNNPQTPNKPQPENETTPTDETPPQPRQTSRERGPDDEKLGTIPAPQPAVVQLWLDQYAANIQHGNNGIAAKPQPKAGLELAQMLAALKTTTQTQPTATDSQPADNVLQDAVSLLNLNLVIENAVTDLKPQLNQQSTNPMTPQLFVKIDLDANQESSTIEPEAALKTRQTNLDLWQTTQELLQSTGRPNPGQTQLRTDNPAENLAQTNPNLINLAAETTPQSGRAPTTAQTPAAPPIADALDKTIAPSAQPQNNLTPDAAAALAVQLKAQVTAAKTQQTSADHKEQKPGFDTFFTHNAPQQPADTLSTTAPLTQAAKSAPNTPQPGAFSDVARQVFESIRTSLSRPLTNQQLTIRLNPPELGRVSIEFQDSKDSVSGILSVTRPETKREIERALPALVRNLENAGIHVKRLEVLLTDQPGRQSLEDQSFSDSLFHQQNLAEKQHLTKPLPRSWQPDTDFADPESKPRFTATEKSIDILI